MTIMEDLNKDSCRKQEAGEGDCEMRVRREERDKSKVVGLRFYPLTALLLLLVTNIAQFLLNYLNK